MTMSDRQVAARYTHRDGPDGLVGYAISRRVDVRLALAALRAAIANRQPPKDCIHHSDRGSQYVNRSGVAYYGPARIYRAHPSVVEYQVLPPQMFYYTYSREPFYDGSGRQRRTEAPRRPCAGRPPPRSGEFALSNFRCGGLVFSAPKALKAYQHGARLHDGVVGCRHSCFERFDIPADGSNEHKGIGLRGLGHCRRSN